MQSTRASIVRVANEDAMCIRSTEGQQFMTPLDTILLALSVGEEYPQDVALIIRLGRLLSIPLQDHRLINVATFPLYIGLPLEVDGLQHRHPYCGVPPSTELDSSSSCSTWGTEPENDYPVPAWLLNHIGLETSMDVYSCLCPCWRPHLEADKTDETLALMYGHLGYSAEALDVGHDFIARTAVLRGAVLGGWIDVVHLMTRPQNMWSKNLRQFHDEILTIAVVARNTRILHLLISRGFGCRTPFAKLQALHTGCMLPDATTSSGRELLKLLIHQMVDKSVRQRFVAVLAADVGTSDPPELAPEHTLEAKKWVEGLKREYLE